jgi:hypothetical protein
MTNQVNIAEKLMVVRLNCSFSFGRITDRPLTSQVNHANKTHALQVKKELFPADAGKTLRALHSVLSAFYAYHKRVTMSAVNEGERLMPVAFYLDYMNEFGVYKVLVQEAYENFVQSYAGSTARAKSLLGPAFNAADYPAVDTLDSYLKFKVQTLPLPQASTLLTTVGDSIQSDVDAFLAEAVQQANADVFKRAQKCLQRMVEQLSDPKGRLFDTLTGNLVELVSFIPEFNVTVDDSLKLLADEIKTQLLTKNVETLRNDPIARQDVAAKAAEILRKMG